MTRPNLWKPSISEWRDHKGGACPTHESAIVQILLRGAERPIVGRQRHEAGKLRWTHRDDCGDIIKFRVLEVPKEDE